MLRVLLLMLMWQSKGCYCSQPTRKGFEIVESGGVQCFCCWLVQKSCALWKSRKINMERIGRYGTLWKCSLYIYIYIYDNRIEKIRIFSFISTGAGFLNYKKYEETFIALLQLHWYGMTLKVCIENPKGWRRRREDLPKFEKSQWILDPMGILQTFTIMSPRTARSLLELVDANPHTTTYPTGGELSRVYGVK